jgi:bacterial/archaeal transporter family protein
MWLVFAILSAVFAALTSILAKIGIEGVNSNLATAIRTVVVVVMAWLMVFLTHAQSGLTRNQQKELDILNLIRLGNRGIVALLLQSLANWGSIEGCAG